MSETSLEEILSRHKKEKKALQGKMLQLKKSVSSGDKKRGKEVQSQITEWEKELTQRHEKELQDFQARTITLSDSQCEDGQNTESLAESFDASVQLAENQRGASSQSRAQKRREKRNQAVQSRAQAIEQSTKDYQSSAGKLETDTITALLHSRNLRLHEIRGDGNCFYSAVSHQLPGDDNSSEISATALRSRVAQYLLAHRDHYSCFVELDPADEEAPDPFGAYCCRIESTNVWAGNVEIEALSKVLQRPIEIIQANAEPCIIGENGEPQANPIVVVYHRLMYGAGGHYNSVKEIQRVPQQVQEQPTPLQLDGTT